MFDTIKEFIYSYVENPFIVLLIIPIMILVYFFVRMNLTKHYADPKLITRKRKTFFLLRTLVYLLLLIAIASPFALQEKAAKGDPYVKIFVDNSASIDIFDKQATTDLLEELEDYLNVEVITLGDQTTTPLGDRLFESLEEQESVLVISDGHTNYGTSLGDVALYANKLNSTIHAINLEAQQDDSSVVILGPSKVSANVEAIFTVKVTSTKPGTAREVTVLLDGQQIYQKFTSEQEITFKRSFSGGTHKLEARVDHTDFFPQNNIYYKSVKVIEKPPVLFYTRKQSPLADVLNQVYAIETTNSLQALNKDFHYGLIINDIPYDQLNSEFSKITDYLTEENGLLVVGGQQSYDVGNYKDSKLEEILPVLTGFPEEKDDTIVNIVIAMDISKSTGSLFGAASVSDVEKALAISAIQNLKDTHNVGFIAFNTDPYVVSALSPLSGKREELITQIQQLQKVGDSYVPAGVISAIDMIKEASGGRNVIVISDGKSGGIGNALAAALDATENHNVKFYTVGVGEAETGTGPEQTSIYGVEYMKKLAEKGNGIYFQASKSPQKIKAIFGGPDAGEKSDAFPLLILDDTHFITQDVRAQATIYGFNSVIPKSTAQLLVATSLGEPILTVWRFGLGKIGALSTDDGSEYAGELLQQQNSILLTRTMNWLIGDPERKNKQYVDMPDTNINKTTDVLVKSPTQPSVEGLKFYKKDKGLYSASIVPRETGFKQILQNTYAVNTQQEYEQVGMSQELRNLVSSTRGIMLEPSDLAGIVSSVQSNSDRIIKKKWYYRWPFLLAALIIFLLDVVVRKIRS